MSIYISLVFILIVTVLQRWFIDKYGSHESSKIEHAEKIATLIKEKSIKSKILLATFMLQFIGGLLLLFFSLVK